MKLNIGHTTHYDLVEPAQYGLQQLRLHPVSDALQKVHDWKVEVEGGTLENSYLDQHGTRVSLISLAPKTEVLRLHAEGHVETHSKDGVLGKHKGYAPLWLYQQHTTAVTRAGQGVRALARAAQSEDDDAIAILHALSRRILSDVRYEIGRTNVETTAEEAIAEGAGVCQDHAHIFIAAARVLGYPARYVSGYLMMDDREIQDAGHAWAEAHVDGLGWVGFDVSNEICPDERYVRLAVGLDYFEAAPVHGVNWGRGGASMNVSVQVQQQSC